MNSDQTALKQSDLGHIDCNICREVVSVDKKADTSLIESD